MKLFIVGTGGHAKIAYEIAESLRYSDNYESHIEEVRNIPYEDLKEEDSSSYYFLAIGDNKKRKEIFTHFPKLNYINLVSDHAIVSSSAKLGVGNIVCNGAIIEANVRIGDFNIINTHVSINHDCIIHNFVHIAPNVSLCGKVVVHEGTLIGVGSSVVPDIEIGAWKIIRAGSVVSESSIINIYKPMLFPDFKDDLNLVLESGFISSQAPMKKSFIHKATEKLKELLGVKHVILTQYW